MTPINLTDEALEGCHTQETYSKDTYCGKEIKKEVSK